MHTFGDSEGDREYGGYAARVMKELCEYYPGRLTVAEIETRMNGSVMDADQVDIGIGQLIQGGAARREGDCVVPTLPGAYMFYLATLETPAPW